MVTLHHCEPNLGGCHTHLFHRNHGPTTAIITPDQAYELFFLEVTLTATDYAGLSGSTTITIGPDTDRDGLLDQDELLTLGTDRTIADTDGDGCKDGRELVSVPSRGGQRDPLNPWDFFDTPGQRFGARRDGRIDLFNDALGVVQRFASNDAGGTAAINRYTDPLTPAPALPAYHPAFDRSPRQPGAKPWDLGPPDGSIDLFIDIFGITAQYGHNCQD